MNLKWLDYITLTLVIIGAVNWGLVGFFKFDLVAYLFGSLSLLSRIIYALVGLSGSQKKSDLAGGIVAVGEEAGE